MPTLKKMGNRSSRSDQPTSSSSDGLEISLNVPNLLIRVKVKDNVETYRRIFHPFNGTISASEIRNEIFRGNSELPADIPAFFSLLQTKNLTIAEGTISILFSESFDYKTWAGNFPVSDFLDVVLNGVLNNSRINSGFGNARFYLDYVLHIISKFGFVIRKENLEQMYKKTNLKVEDNFIIALGIRLNIYLQSKEGLLKVFVDELKKENPMLLYMNEWKLDLPDRTVIYLAIWKDGKYAKFLKYSNLKMSQVSMLRNNLDTFETKVKIIVKSLHYEEPPPYVEENPE